MSRASKHAHATINLGALTGGAVANQVPDYAEALLDVRLMPGITIEDVQGWFAELSAELPSVEAEYLVGNGPIENPAGAAVDLFCQLTREVTGRAPTPILSHGSSDGRFFVEHGTPVISVPPTGGGQHSDHEWVELASLQNYYEIVRRFTVQWAAAGTTPISASAPHRRASRV